MFRKLVLLALVPAALAAQDSIPPIPTGTFRPISLAEALNLAKENNVQAITAANGIRSANNLIRTTKAQLFLPNLTLSAGQSKSAGDRLGQSGTLVPYTSVWSYNNGLNGQLTLYDGGKTYADLKMRKADVLTAEASQTSTQATVAFNVKTQYNLVLQANEAEAAARAQLALANQNLAVTVARVNAGAANIADSLNSVVNVGNAQLAILNAQQSLRAASAQLTRYVATAYLVTANPADTSDLARITTDSATIMQMALAGPEIRRLESQLSSNEASKRSAKSRYLPSITAGFQISGNGTSNPYGFGSSPYPYQRSINLGASYALFDRFTRENNIQAADISIDNT
jgi:outer membrane protein